MDYENSDTDFLKTTSYAAYESSLTSFKRLKLSTLPLSFEREGPAGGGYGGKSSWKRCLGVVEWYTATDTRRLLIQYQTY